MQLQNPSREPEKRDTGADADALRPWEEDRFWTETPTEQVCLHYLAPFRWKEASTHARIHLPFLVASSRLSSCKLARL